MTPTEFLFSLVVLVMALGITNLIKGFDLFYKYKPSDINSNIKDRWRLRFLWGVNLAFLTIQLIWGMRLKLDEIDSLIYYLYYIVLSGLVYGMIVYIFPDNVENVFKREGVMRDVPSGAKEKKRKEQMENYDEDWQNYFIKRVVKFYWAYISYLSATIPMSFIFKNHLRKDEFLIDPAISCWVGAFLKGICVLVMLITIHNKRKNNRVTNSDYIIWGLSISTHVFFIFARTINVFPN